MKYIHCNSICQFSKNAETPFSATSFFSFFFPSLFRQGIRTGWLHPTLNLENPIEEVEGIDCCAGEKKKHDVTAAISNSFGFGGHNSVVVFAPWTGN